MLLLDREYFISPQYSHELEPILRIKSLGERNFLDIIRTLVSERSFKTAKDYMDMLFNEEKSERTLQRINPLEEVEVNFPNATTGGYDTRFLTIEFRRIYDENEEISQVFVAVSDVTERVRLERELRESEQRKERQFGMLLDIMNIDPRGLDEFVQTAAENLRIMNDSMKAEEFAAAGVENTVSAQVRLRSRLDTVYRCVHIIKGNASMLQLTYFMKVCDGFESKIVQLRDRRALGGDDFLSIVMAQAELRQDLEELQELRERFVGLGHAGRLPERNAPTAFAPAAFAPAASAPVPQQSELVTQIAAFANQMAGALGKEVRVTADGFSTDGLPDFVQRTIKDVVIQLARNSVTHGIENADARQSLGKARYGTLAIRGFARTPNDAFVFSFRDDGRGLDPQHIRERAVAKGLIAADQAASMTDEQIVAQIFRPGFSTAEETTMDAGRGIGMNVIKEAIVDKLGGRLSLNSEPGKFTEFTFTLPVKAAKLTADGVAALAYN